MKRIISFFIFIFVLTGVAYADDKLAFRYNIIATDSDNSSIDKKKGKISFRIFENQGKVFFKGSEIKIIDNKFDISIENLTGKQVLTFSNEQKEEVSFTYYISDDNGLVKDYNLPGTDADVYVKTIDTIKITYTSKECSKINQFLDLLNKIPAKVKSNIKEITLLPVNHVSGAAGTTNYNKITFYNLFTYSTSQVKNIVFHEIAHTWAADLIKQKIMDYSYTNFSKAVVSDKNYVSNYSKKSVQNGKYNEDFAESFAFYMMDKDAFSKKFSNRASYLTDLII